MRPKADPRIAYRAYEQFARYMDSNNMSVSMAAKEMGISPGLPYRWFAGETTPSATLLNQLDECGLDIYYIVTGKEGEQ